jgi:hypothetical protein
MFDIQDLYPLLLLAMAQLALIGGIGAALLRIVSRQRAVEAMYRERIAAVIRGAGSRDLAEEARLSS